MGETALYTAGREKNLCQTPHQTQRGKFPRTVVLAHMFCLSFFFVKFFLSSEKKKTKKLGHGFFDILLLIWISAGQAFKALPRGQIDKYGKHAKVRSLFHLRNILC